MKTSLKNNIAKQKEAAADAAHKNSSLTDFRL
jgi:hypothetical protein